MYRHSWENHELVTLLAWLDFSVASKLNFWESIIARLEECHRIHTGEDFSITKPQIVNKLLSLPRRKIIPTLKLADILARGTTCIPNLTPDILVEVKNLVKVFEKDFSKSAGAREISVSSQNRIVQGESQLTTRSDPVSLDIFSVLRKRVCF